LNLISDPRLLKKVGDIVVDKLFNAKNPMTTYWSPGVFVEVKNEIVLVFENVLTI